jgi:hypothetical protein
MKKNTFSSRDSFFIGASTALLFFLPATFCLVFPLVEFLLRKVVKLPLNTNLDDFLLVWGCFLPVFGLGLLFGYWGGKLGSQQSTNKRSYSFLGAVLGGLLATLVVAIVLNLWVYHLWLTY